MRICKNGHRAKRDSRGECTTCIRERRMRNGYYATHKVDQLSKPKHHPAILPVADFGYIKPPTKAQLMGRR